MLRKFPVIRTESLTTEAEKDINHSSAKNMHYQAKKNSSFFNQIKLKQEIIKGTSNNVTKKYNMAEENDESD